MSIRSEWRRLVERLRRHAASGGTFQGLADEVGISRPTLYNWMNEMPDTVEKAARTMEVLQQNEKRLKRREPKAKAKRKEARSKMPGMPAKREALCEVRASSDQADGAGLSEA